MKETVKSLVFGARKATVIHECRRCGPTVSASAACRPQCGADAIAEYRIE